MAKTKLLFSTLVLAAAAMPLNLWAFTQFLTGNELHEYCTSCTGNNELYCLGYMAGVSDTLNHPLVRNDRLGICMPKSVSMGQVQDIVLKFFDENPQIRHLSASGLVSAALLKVFPCK